MIRKEMTKYQARERARKEYERVNGVRLGTFHQKPDARPDRRVNARTGTCMICKKLACVCVCDDKSAWMKERIRDDDNIT